MRLPPCLAPGAPPAPPLAVPSTLEVHARCCDVSTECRVYRRCERAPAQLASLRVGVAGVNRGRIDQGVELVCWAPIRAEAVVAHSVRRFAINSRHLSKPYNVHHLALRECKPQSLQMVSALASI